ncbi:asparaginase [Litchfieldella xinjiangensis]|uniref:asparaginase n=1 Tax=Litchfieldella xinjiangensis TaxID=1166948 RepID=UPI0005BCF186|nr:asparaginase [Halomonas xinjiangensis]
MFANLPVLIIYTGGTIGMVPGRFGLEPGTDFEPRLRDSLASLPPARRASLPDFDVIETDHPIDSSAATPTEWQVIASLLATHYSKYRGFVVLHGTDTLAWTASSLAYQLQGIDKPVVLSGAMAPLESPGSDALSNIEDALRFSADTALQEVGLCFAGRLLRGVRSRKWSTHDADAFISPNYPVLGEIVEHQAIVYANRGLDALQRGAPRFELPDYRGLGDSPVVRMTLWPGISADRIARWLDDETTKGALLEVWGGGNIPDDPQLIGVLAKAVGEGKLVAAISQCPEGSIAFGAYAAGNALAEADVVSGDGMTPEATMTKMVHLLALPLPDDQRRSRFSASLVGER